MSLKRVQPPHFRKGLSFLQIYMQPNPSNVGEKHPTKDAALAKIFLFVYVFGLVSGFEGSSEKLQGPNLCTA